MNGKFKSVKHIINKLLVNPLMQNINESDLAQYIGDAIKMIGAPNSYEIKDCTITIKDFRGTLPSDLVYIDQTLWRTGTNGDDEGVYVGMRYASSTMHSKYHKLGSPDFTQISEFTYSLNNHYIHADVSDGEVFMVYRGLVVDELGMPQVPDNIKFEKACIAYIELQHYKTMWVLGKLPDKVWQHAEQEWAWYVGAAQTAGQLQTIDEAESFANAFSRMILKPLQHGSFFTNHGSQEYLYKTKI